MGVFGGKQPALVLTPQAFRWKMEGFNKLAMCKSLTEGGEAGQTMGELLFGPPNTFEVICEFCRASDSHMRTVAFETLLIVLRRLCKAERKLQADLQDKILLLVRRG